MIEVAEWSESEGNIKIPQDRDLLLQAKNFIDYCAKEPHRELDIEQEARENFTSYCTFFNIKVKLSRDNDNADEGAEQGTAPWKLGMMAGALLLWDVMWDVGPVAYKEQRWTVRADHVHRAFMLIEICAGIREILVDRPDASQTVPGGPDHDDDRNLPGVKEVRGITHQRLCSRMLSRCVDASKLGERFKDHETKLVCQSVICHKLVTSAERGKGGVENVPVAVWRQLAGACSAPLDTFDANLDSLLVARPEDASDAYTAALKQWANMTVAQFCQMLDCNKMSKESNTYRGGPRPKRSREGAPEEAADEAL